MSTSTSTGTGALLRSAWYVLWGGVLVWGVIVGNNLVAAALAARYPDAGPYLDDIFSDAVILFVALMPALWAPRFFGYQVGRIAEHTRLLLAMAVFFVAAPLLYRVTVGETPFGANTWFFEGVVVPLAEEGLVRGVLFSMLLWGFGRLYEASVANAMAIVCSALLFATAHLNNLGSYPASFVWYQVGYSVVVGLAFGYARSKTQSIYPAIALHALFNLAGTL